MRPLLSVVLAAAAAVCASAQVSRRTSSTDIQAKVALEGSVERRLQEVLRRVLDSEDVVVVVNADLLTETERGDVEILPGVAVKESVAAAAPLELPAALVKKISVTVFVERAMSDARVELARATAAKMVGLKPERGDAVAVERMDFPKAPPPTAAEKFRRAFQEPTGVLALSWLLVAVMALVLLSRRFFDPFVGAVRDAARGLAEKSSGPASAAGSAAAGDGPAAREAAPAAARAARADEPERRIPFSFVRDADLPTLNMLLAEQPVPTVAAIVNFLTPALASAALTAMAPERRDEVVTRMAAPVLLAPAEVSALEDSIRARIDCMIGGEEKLAEILDQSPVELQTELLETVRANDEEPWERLQRRVVTLADIALLDEAGIATLSRAVPLKSMAIALKSSPALSRQVTAKLKTGLGQWLKQEIELTRTVSEDVRQAEMKRVVKALSMLVREGRLVLNKQYALPPLPALDLPAVDLPAAAPEPAAEPAPAEGDAP
ncbi:MAG: hypothetical protein HY079_09520 [Elusimicrobia bacterium]|nr:hypothetical protein [Elusimicrobiota bacterium]